MKLSDFDYDLPKELIAQYPAKMRDSSRLLILERRRKRIIHRYFRDIVDYLKRGDLLVLNDAKVLPARIIGRRVTGGKSEILILRQKKRRRFEVLMRPGRLKINERILFGHSTLSGQVISKNEIEFNTDDIKNIYSLGEIPLPPYIKRRAQDLDKKRYQTIYAKNPGAVASPTAGLHFSDGLIRKIRAKGIDIAFITLHVGYATFKPVKCNDVTKHSMEYEYLQVSRDAYKSIREAKSKSKRIIAVGTTSCRTLEVLNYKQSKGPIKSWTNLFIYPGYEFKTVDALITNFHLPRTTLLMLVSAFAGRRLIKKAYQEAIDEKYRFYSYGDAMLIV